MNNLMLEAINSQIGNAEDNLLRAKAAFRNYSPERMNEVWSGNGETAQEVLDAYQARYDALVLARNTYLNVEK